jgi:molecular chaperone GrpE
MDLDNGKTSAVEESAAADPRPVQDHVELSEPATQLEAIAAERDRLAAEKAELEEMLKRRQADHENFRRRAGRERAEVFEMATMEAVRNLVPILDDFERAVQSLPADDGPSREYAKGVQLIYQRFQDALVKLGLEPVESAGKSFDPNLHHAVQKEHRQDCDDHMVLEEYQRGYNFKGKLLRPAMVKVSVKD